MFRGGSPPLATYTAPTWRIRAAAGGGGGGTAVRRGLGGRQPRAGRPQTAGSAGGTRVSPARGQDSCEPTGRWEDEREQGCSRSGRREPELPPGEAKAKQGAAPGTLNPQPNGDPAGDDARAPVVSELADGPRVPILQQTAADPKRAPGDHRFQDRPLAPTLRYNPRWGRGAENPDPEKWSALG